MKVIDRSAEQDVLIQRVTDLPGKILIYHDIDHLSQIVLHYLAHKDCFGLESAAYFVDNPDFDHLLGIAGFSRNECCFESVEKLWVKPVFYQEKIDDSVFGRKVKNHLKGSIKRQNIDLNNADQIINLGREIGMVSPEYFSWDLKYGNQGLFVFEKKGMTEYSKKILKNAVRLLGFCSI